jgi:DNA-binding FrmR family transcriptional regulator
VPTKKVTASHCEQAAVEDGRKALDVDPAVRASNLRRLRRIEGQVRGLHKMVEEDRYCAEILVQVSSVQEALRGVAQELLRHHLRHCVTAVIQHGEHRESEAMYEELLGLFAKYSR